MPPDSTTDDLARKKRHWLADNPGIQARIANELSVSKAHVSDVFLGKSGSRDKRIESRFAKLGAPGFDKTRRTPRSSNNNPSVEALR